MRQGKVYVHGVFAGLLSEQDTSHYFFQYDAEYLRRADAFPVCLTMPLCTEPYESSYLFPFFSNLLSEGENRKFQAAVLHLDESDDFGFLLATTSYDTIGCVTVKPVE